MPSNTGIRFVMEGPNAARIRLKKRARLVTACDACRSKKVKCLQLNPDASCEACRSAGVQCSYQDRDRFHAERGMTTVTSRAPSPTTSSTSDDCNIYPTTTTSSYFSSNRTTKPLPLNIWPSTADLESEQRLMQPFSRHFGPTSPTPGFQNHHHHHHDTRPLPNSVSSTTTNTSTSTPFSETPLPSSSSSSHLFDPDRPHYPHPDLLFHLLQIFFDNLQCEFPFLEREVVMRRANTGTLPAVLATSLAGLSARFSDKKDLVTARRDAAGEPFVRVAKMLVIQMMTVPSIDLLHALVVIAWAEYGSAHDRELFMYSRMAVAMLLDMGLENPKTIKMARSEEEKDMLRLTWWSVAKVDLTSSWVTGKPSAMRDIHFDIALPSTQRVYQSIPSRTLVFAYLTELLTIRKDVINSTNVDNSDKPKTSAAMALSDIQSRLSGFYRVMPESLAFNEDNWRSFSEHHQGPLLLLLHFGFHGLNAFVNWPSLFKEFSDPVPHSIHSAYASARAIVDTIRIAQAVYPAGLLGNPFFDMPISIAARVLLGAKSAMGMLVSSTSSSDSLFTEESNNAAFQTCVMALGDMSKYWRGAAVVKDKLLENYPTQALSFDHLTSPSTTSSSIGQSPGDSPTFSIPGSLSSTSTTSLPSPNVLHFSSMPLLTEEELRTAFNGSTTTTTTESASNDLSSTIFADFFTHGGMGQNQLSPLTEHFVLGPTPTSAAATGGSVLDPYDGGYNFYNNGNNLDNSIFLGLTA